MRTLKSLDYREFCWLQTEQWAIGLRVERSSWANLLVGESDWTGRHHSYRGLKESKTRQLKVVDLKALMLEGDEADLHLDDHVAHCLDHAVHHPGHDAHQTPASFVLGHC